MDDTVYGDGDDVVRIGHRLEAAMHQSLVEVQSQTLPTDMVRRYMLRAGILSRTTARFHRRNASQSVRVANNGNIQVSL